VYSCPISFLPERVEIAKLFVDWVTNPSDNFKTRLVIEELINKGIAHISGASKDQRSSEETIQNRIVEEAYIAKLWAQVKKGNDLFSVINNLPNPNPTLEKIRDGLLNLSDLYINFKKEKKGEFIKQLSLVSGIWFKPSELLDDITQITKLLNSLSPSSLGWVQLNTMKKAKGLEADIVFIVGLEDDILPDPRSDLIEEARLFYVSMTRAKEKLFLFHSYKRPRNITYGIDIMDKPRSKFLDVIGRKSEWKG
jgi:superfamily I DNA/RNA helicase